MTTRRRSRSGPRRGPRPALAWMNSATSPTSVLAGVSSFADLLPINRVPDGYAGGLTVRRMLISFNVRGETVNAENTGSFGVSVVTRDAIAGAVLPDPAADLVDWYVQKNISWFADTLAYRRWEFDIRTSRKVRGEDRTLVAMFDNGGSAVATWTVEWRLLLQRG